MSFEGDVTELAHAIAARELEHRSGWLRPDESTRCYAAFVFVEAWCAQQSAPVLARVLTEAARVLTEARGEHRKVHIDTVALFMREEARRVLHV